MKKTVKNVKLALSRETVCNLDLMDLKDAKGGLAKDAGKVSSDNRDCTYSRLCE
jgi:hypothetical protein